MKRFLISICAVLALFCGSQNLLAKDLTAAPDALQVPLSQKLPMEPLSIQIAEGLHYDFSVEIAGTNRQIMIGLMNRDQMDDDHGMLFLFKQPAERSFWMKNTLIPLDMLFIRSDGTIHKIHENAQPNDLTSIKSDGPVPAVLELNGGLTRKLGIKVGDKVFHDFFGNKLAR